jgi:Na+-driven multidrug efflux pump
MGTERLPMLILSMAVPAVLANLANAIYNITDRIFVGNIVGRDALGAIAVVFPLTNISAALSMFITTGGGALIALTLGKRQYLKVSKIYSNIVAQSIGTGALIAVAYLIFAPALVVMCGAVPESPQYPQAITYLRITAVGQIFHVLNIGQAAVIRAEGNIKYSTFVSMLGGTVNVAFNALFMIVFRLGIAGAALGTMMGQITAAAFSVSYFVRKKSISHWMGLRYVRVKRILQIISLGFAPSVLQGISFVSNIITNNSLRYYADIFMGPGGGDLAISAFSVIHSVDMFLIAVVLGFNQAISPILGYNYGMRQYGRVRDATLIGQVAGTAVSVVMWSLMMFFPRMLFGMFGAGDTALMDYGAAAMRMSKTVVFVLGFQILASMYFSAIGRPKTAMLISISRQGLFFVPALLILPRFFALDGVLISNAISDGCSVVVVALIYFREIARLNRLIAGKE